MRKYLKWLYRFIRHMLSTVCHKFWVLMYMLKFCLQLLKRALKHDLSKFSFREASVFATSPFNLKGLSYESDEYKAALRFIKPAVEEHYRRNRHHPEYFMRHNHDAIMGVLDKIEMVVDWKASTRKHKTGNISRSIELNQKRFGYGVVEKELYRSIAAAVGSCTDLLDIEVARIQERNDDKDNSGEEGSPNT